MENNLKQNLEDFLDQPKDKDKKEDNNVVIIKHQEDGLFERVDKTLITSDGRRLLN